MAEPVIQLEINEGTEGTPTWTAIETALRWTGPAGIGDPFPAPIGDADEAFFDADAAPNDGELWHDATADVQCTVAGRNTNVNVLQANETGAADGTADPPEFTAYDDAADGVNRTAPTVWLLVGTAGTGSISTIRAVETTPGAPGAGWTGQVHDAAPTEGTALNGDGSKEVCASALAAGGTKTFGLAACAPHDATAGQTAFVYQLQYTYT